VTDSPNAVNDTLTPDPCVRVDWVLSAAEWAELRGALRERCSDVPIVAALESSGALGIG